MPQERTSDVTFLFQEVVAWRGSTPFLAIHPRYSKFVSLRAEFALNGDPKPEAQRYAPMDISRSAIRGIY